MDNRLSTCLLERLRLRADTDTDTDMITVSLHVFPDWINWAELINSIQEYIRRMLDFFCQNIGCVTWFECARIHHEVFFPDKHGL